MSSVRWLLVVLLLWAWPFPLLAQTCRQFAKGYKTGSISDSRLSESSGVVASRRNAGIWWSHNDAGGNPRIFALDEKGRKLGRFEVSGAKAEDWEDIAAAPCPDGTSCLYIGDIGDNDLSRKSIVIYRLPEPHVDPDKPIDGSTTSADIFKLTFPDKPHDCETLFVHPKSRDMILVTKETDNTGIVYRLPGDAKPGKAVLEKMGTLHMKTPGVITGGDISPLGDQIILRTYETAFLYAPGPDGIPTDSNLIGNINVPSMEQGEAVGYSNDGQHLLFTTEKAPMPIFKVSCEGLEIPSGCSATKPRHEALWLLFLCGFLWWCRLSFPTPNSLQE